MNTENNKRYDIKKSEPFLLKKGSDFVMLGGAFPPRTLL